MQHVIAGAGPAGVIAAETLRKIDPTSAVTLIGDEPEPPYSRMAIPYLLIDRIDEAGTYLRKSKAHFKQLGIEVRQGRVTSVEPTQNRIGLDGGGSLKYDRLLLATGARPILPPIPGIKLAGVHPCWTLHDSRAIAKLARPGSKVVLIGAGFIGCIILEALAKRGVHLTVVETGDRMVPRMMNQTAGGLIKNWCEKKGIAVHTSTSVTAIEENKKSKVPLTVRLSGGENVDAELVIVATGVRPNVEFAEKSGVELNDGIVVNHFLQSNISNIYAAGDVAKGSDFSTGNFEVHAIQPTAAEHGRVAAQNMAGRPTYYAGSFNMNVLDTAGLVACSFGLWMGVDGGSAAELVDRERFRYINLQFGEDILIGATSLGLTQHVGVLRGLIQGRVKLGDWKQKLMQDPTRIMEAYLARNYAFVA
jgi:NAD(P)H-nitrite reductase large subunit